MELGEISRKIYKYLREKTKNEANIQRGQQHGQEETEIRKWRRKETEKRDNTQKEMEGVIRGSLTAFNKMEQVKEIISVKHLSWGGVKRKEV